MKVVLLAGGKGTRLAEETHIRPKPMVEIGGMPILWHIMKVYSHFGLNDFIICLGYKGHTIKEYFVNYSMYNSHITVDMDEGHLITHKKCHEPWKVTLVDTGEESMTGGRLRRIREFIGDETCLVTYGDGLGNVDINALVNFHREQGRKATLTAVYPPARFGALDISDQGVVEAFKEKPVGDGSFINGGFFVLEPSVLEMIRGDECIFEQDILPQLSQEKELAAFRHKGFWLPMDTLRDKMNLQSLWESQKAPWKLWE